LNNSSGCMMLDLPELFAPARIVSGAISMLCSSLIDLKPATVIRVIPSGAGAGLGLFEEALFFAISIILRSRRRRFIEQRRDGGLECFALFAAGDLLSNASLPVNDICDGKSRPVAELCSDIIATEH